MNSELQAHQMCRSTNFIDGSRHSPLIIFNFTNTDKRETRNAWREIALSNQTVKAVSRLLSMFATSPLAENHQQPALSEGTWTPRQEISIFHTIESDTQEKQWKINAIYQFVRTQHSRHCVFSPHTTALHAIFYQLNESHSQVNHRHIFISLIKNESRLESSYERR